MCFWVLLYCSQCTGLGVVTEKDGKSISIIVQRPVLNCVAFNREIWHEQVDGKHFTCEEWAKFGHPER